ncbi:MAG: type IV pilus secretin PilQ family protein [Proteobacteria bacterium]|nr:type IV pilus secretin PilQ family protein [Pseudomonadota bacterium]
MTTLLKRGLVVVTSLVLTVLASAASASTIESIEFSSLPGDKTEIRMGFDGSPPEPTGYTIEKPARIVLDMPGVTSGLEEKHHNLGIGNARRVSVISTKDRTRAIVNLTNLVAYETRVEGNTLVVLVGAGAESSGGAQTAAAQTSDAPVPSRAGSAGSSEILGVDFRRGKNGEGRIVLELSNPKAPIDVVSDAKGISIEVRNTQLPAELRRRLDVTDFATPVQTIDALQQGQHSTFTITASGNYDYLAYQADGTLSIDVTPVTAEEIANRDDVFKFSGEKLSLNFQDIEVRSVLQLIADFTDLNLVASDTVQGRITLRLKNVPWDQALELILKTKGLDQRQVGNVLLVAPAAEIAAREKLELENQRQISELAPLRTEFIQIRYASATELFALFDTSGETGSSIMSSRGSVIVDERTNSIILTDTQDKLEEFRRVIAQLDVPVRQVLIESRIVTANSNFSEQLGIRWGGGAIKNNGSSNLKYGGSRETLIELQDIITDPAGDGEITSPGDLIVDLGVTATGASSFGIGLTGAGYLVDLEISALAADGHAEVVARPKVITADKSTAIIESGVEIPYQEATSSGATSTSFKDAVLSLEVTPQITPDDRVIMVLSVKQDTVGQIFNGVPSINTNEIQTQVLVDNGQTVVLGGIFKTDKNVSTEKTPFLGDLPYVGRLFRRTVERDDKQELLIFITPKIIQDSLSNR